MNEPRDTYTTGTPETSAQDVDRLRQENAELRARLADLETIITMMPVPIAISQDATADRVEINPAFAALLGTDTDLNFSRSAGPISADKPFRLLRNGQPVGEDELPLKKATRTAQEIRDELEIVRDDSIRYHIYGFARPLFDSQGAVRRAFAAFVDVSERKRAEKALEQSMQALKNANAELQQFAYAASHDLQEPLRTIASYTQLLERRYADDKDASEFTAFIVEGVHRMNTLIHDLLLFSRVGASEKLRRTPVILGNALQFALLNLDRSIKEERAVVTQDELPEAIADETQLVQLFQNLISNSLKYRGEQSPLIHVSCEEIEDEWLITVRDNGIGIDPQYHKQIFGVFKRLHGRSIPGTGIGLAICRKIVENHGGRIWVESDGKAGSAFRFTLPK
jgi:signal transduction histidine kinase